MGQANIAQNIGIWKFMLWRETSTVENYIISKDPWIENKKKTQPWIAQCKRAVAKGIAKKREKIMTKLSLAPAISKVYGS